MLDEACIYVERLMWMAASKCQARSWQCRLQLFIYLLPCNFSWGDLMRRLTDHSSSCPWLMISSVE